MSDWAQEYFERGYAQRWGLPPITDHIRVEVTGLWKHLNLTPSLRLVDVGCGHGRHALALAQRGSTVVGVDFAIALLTEARHLGAKLGVQACWVRGDMRILPFRREYFDAAILLDAFGLFETEADNDAVLANIARILVPHGRLCLKVVNGGPILADFRGSDTEEREGTVVAISRKLTLEPPRITEKIVVSGSRGNGEYERRQRLYRSEEIYRMVESAGFSVVGVFSSADGIPFEPTISATMWLIIERKADTSKLNVYKSPLSVLPPHPCDRKSAFLRWIAAVEKMRCCDRRRRACGKCAKPSRVLQAAVGIRVLCGFPSAASFSTGLSRARKIDGFGRLISQRLMRRLPIVELKLKVLSQAGDCFVDAQIVRQVNMLVFDGAPQAFDKDIVQRSAFSIHADGNPLIRQSARERLACELCALIGIEDLRLGILQRPIQRRNAKARVHVDRYFPAQHVAAVPIHDRHQIDKALP
jgi:ubiquinone/menaquinone biosynthesis C-methylase UbiE